MTGSDNIIASDTSTNGKIPLGQRLKASSQTIWRDKNNRWHRWLRTLTITICSLVIFLLLWWDLALLVQTAAIPTPDKVWKAAVDLFTNGDAVTGISMWANIWISLRRFLEGFALAFLVAIPIGMLMGYSKTFKEFMDPVFEILRPIAPIAWAPVLLFATGYTWGPVLVVFIGIFFPLVSNTVFGVKKIDHSLIDAARTLGSSNTQVFYKVMFPCAVPYIMNGIRVGSGIGWMCIVASELMLLTEAYRLLRRYPGFDRILAQRVCRHLHYRNPGDPDHWAV